ncbi:MAG TPA: C-terminal binding protein, partial [Armatimonadota bacterium]|nr:C-terminal binding protein [Armatimonadota bacterium]
MRLKVALVTANAERVPAWAREELAREGIELVARQCRTTEEAVELARDADVLWLFGANRVITPESLSQLLRCAAMMRSGSGTDDLPVEEATRLGIVVVNTPAAIAEAVAEHAIALLFAIVRQTSRLDRVVREGRWGGGGTRVPGLLGGGVLGLVGFGHIGRHVARKLRGFEMRILVSDPAVPAEEMARYGVEPATLEEILPQVDFLSLHCPLIPATRGLIGEAQLRQMKPTAYLVNTTRGGVVDEAALVRALREGWIAGAALDVLEQEPPPPNHPLFALENVVITPHMAAS